MNDLLLVWFALLENPEQNKIMQLLCEIFEQKYTISWDLINVAYWWDWALHLSRILTSNSLGYEDDMDDDAAFYQSTFLRPEEKDSYKNEESKLDQKSGDDQAIPDMSMSM